MIRESKKRTIVKTVSWRVVAILNSWMVLSFSYYDSNLFNALLMNLTGFIIFYFFDRVWSKIDFGREVDLTKVTDENISDR